MEKLICDRVEDGVAVLEKEDGGYLNININELDFSVAEGDILIFDGEKYISDEVGKCDRKMKMLELQKKLAEKKKKE